MRGYLQGHSEYEYNQVRKSGMQAAKNSQTYRAKYLELRKVMREYSRTTGHEFPSDINKLIGLK